MRMAVDTSDLNRAVATLGIAEKRVGAQAAAIVRKTTADIQSTAQRIVAVDTGFLRSSITSEVTGTGSHGIIEGKIGPTADYGIFVEKGTSRMPPKPYMVPAAERHFPAMYAAVEQLGARLLP